MDIAQPVASHIESVEFTSFLPEEIRSISVKRIENPQTFDNLIRPLPGGLYDSALGAWGDIPCSTCSLFQASCPGHPGHIELPLPVYHPIYMDLLLRLVRAQCIHCYRFRMPRDRLNAEACKLRLLQYGLVNEACQIDNLFADDGHDGHDSDTGDEMDGAEKSIRTREAFVKKTLESNRVTRGQIRTGKHEGAAQMRREILQSLLRDIALGRMCATCKGLSPSYRKDGFVKIFQKALSPKDAAKLAQGNFKLRDALTVKHQGGIRSERDQMRDEAIADMDSADSAASDDNDEDAEGGGESLDVDGDVEMKVSGKPKKKDPAAGQKYLTPAEMRARIEFLFTKERAILEVMFNSRPLPKGMRPAFGASSFFIDAILVPPNRYRPEAKSGDSRVTEAQQNTLFSSIIAAASTVATVHREVHSPPAETEGGTATRRRDVNELYEMWALLQHAVNSMIDDTKNPMQAGAGRTIEEGIKQKLEKKEGLFRKNMMGKRVNFAARSVISPDPNIETNEIGVPPVFAVKLTFPEPVTSHNFKEMQQAVINGNDVWPGAAAIEDEDGRIVHLRAKKPDERLALANQLLAPSTGDHTGSKNKKVHRHITNGDVVLMNRQPTLHKPSIMGHRVRVLPGEKTIRMHYANCNTYNADFDGDEMNMHFPQSELARAEALQIADTDHQYLSGTAGKPLRGLIQDHLSVSVRLCSRDTFFGRDQYYQLVYAAIRPEHGHIMMDRIQLVSPAILKPCPLWTGKQIITTVLQNIKPASRGPLWMTGSSQVKAAAWGSKPRPRRTVSADDNEPEPDEGSVRFVDGEFIHGILDKPQLGPGSGGFIHSVHEVYGPSVAGKLLSSMGRLLTIYLNMGAFTCGMDDLKLTQPGEVRRREKLKGAQNVGLAVAAKFVGLEDQSPSADDPELLRRLEAVMRDDEKQKDLELLLNQGCSALSGQLTEACVPAGLEKQFPKNQMQAMTISGAKGSGVNANLISSNLAQQVLEGRRVPLMVSGKSLPCFRPFETHIRAGGYIVNRFLTGIRPQEYYFHHMAGREGLIDTAVKTANSGYLQRCLIKGLEGLKVSYDGTVRNSDGSLVQFLYGEDGMDPTKQKYLHDFRFVLKNCDSELDKLDLRSESSEIVLQDRDKLLKSIKSAIKHANDKIPSTPVNSEKQPSRFAYASSEKFYTHVNDFLKNKSKGLVSTEKSKKGENKPGGGFIGRKAAESIFYAKHGRSAIEPGEAVGIVAGQSVGEPSTQMTLNTFHLAGHSAKNVTLGVPRLREILMTNGESIKKPSMTLFLNEELSVSDGERFAKAISVLPLAHVMDKATVAEKLGSGRMFNPAKLFDIRLELFPSSEYMESYAIQISDVLDAIERKFLPRLESVIAKEKRQKATSDARPDIGTKAGTIEVAARAAPAEENDDDDDDDDDGDGDATSAKKKANRSEGLSYGANDDDDDDIQRENQADLTQGESEGEDEGIGGSPMDMPTDDEDGDEEGGSMSSRADRVLHNNDHVAKFRCDEKTGGLVQFTLEFDAEMPKLLMESLVKECVQKTVIQKIEGIDNCTFVLEDAKDPKTGKAATDEMGQAIKVPMVHTAGANLRAMQKYADYINPNKTRLNDIAAILKAYGIEACRNTIIQELHETFSGHGIAVDNRHLNLIGDYMTRNGGLTPFNRTGLKGSVSPFTKMSFETTVGFLKEAVLEGDWDDLRAPSSRIVMGQHAKVGTNSFDVLAATG